MPNISVIIPIYKVEPYLRKCVDSVLSQTYADFEVVLVDDGSPDGCGRICDEYAAKDPRIVVIHQENGGLSAARNAGLAVAKGGWVTFLDSDDWINPVYLESLVGASRQGCRVCISVMRQTDGDRDLAVFGKELPNVVSPEEVYDKCDLLAVWACGKLFQRDLIGNLEFPVGKIQEDEFFTYRVLFRADKVAIAHEAVYNYLSRADSIVGGRWYPARVLAVEGMREQLVYFESNGFPIAARHVRRRLLKWLSFAIISFERDCPTELGVIRSVRELLAELLPQNKQLLADDPQLEYLVLSAKHRRLRIFVKVYYAMRVAFKDGPSAVFRKIFKKK